MRGIPRRTTPAHIQTRTLCTGLRQEPALQAQLLLAKRWSEEQKEAEVTSMKVWRSGVLGFSLHLVPPLRTRDCSTPLLSRNGSLWLGKPIGKLSLFLRKSKTKERIHLELVTSLMVPYLPEREHTPIFSIHLVKICCCTQRK